MSAEFPSPRVKRSSWEIQQAVLFALVQRELKSSFGGRWLGAFWILLEPVAHLGYLLLLFGGIRQRVVPGVPFVMFLLTGLIPFFIFRSVSLRVMGSVDGSRGLFGYRQVKPIDPIIARATVDTLMNSVVYVFFLAIFGWYGLPWFPDQPLGVFAVSVVLVAMAFGLGLLFVVLTDDFPRARIFIRIAYLPLYLISGVIFPIKALPTAVQGWLLWNPLLHLMELSRKYFFNQYQAIQDASLAYPAAVALVLLAVSLALYRLRRERLLAS
jgi:capsular polysaccharide transport system permease protein